MSRIRLPHRFIPREYQRPVMRAICEEGIKRAICCWHRRAGKDKTFLNILAIEGMKRMGNYAYYFPTATLGRKALWDNIDVKSRMRVIDHLPPEIIAKTNEQQMKLTLVNGSTIQVLGTETLDVVGGNYAGVIFSESAQHNPMAWDYTRPILAENGGWALFNGTQRGKNWFYHLLQANRGNPKWFTQVLTVDDTHALTEDDINEERRAGMREEMIRQEFYCDFSAANSGSIYGRFIERAEAENRVGNFLVDGRAPVHTAWDLGSPRNTVVTYFQVLPFGVIRFVDCDSGLDMTLAERVAHMRAKGYNLGNAYLPHDAAQTGRNGLTFEAEARAAGLTNVFVVPPCQSVWPGINHAGSMFGQFEFRLPACERFIEALRGYHTLPDTSSGIVRNEPAHTWESHFADAFRTMVEASMHGVVPKHASGMQRDQGRPMAALTGSRRW
jgi:hypothetical protein